MKLRSIRVENFRSFRDQTIHLDDYACLVGPNGCGKSTVLLALNVFFRNSAASSANLLELTKEDFHLCETNQPIRITLTFNDLSDEAIDDFSAYVRHGQLVVSAVAEWSEQHQAAPVQQFGSRLVPRLSLQKRPFMIVS